MTILLSHFVSALSNTNFLKNGKYKDSIFVILIYSMWNIFKGNKKTQYALNIIEYV